MAVILTSVTILLFLAAGDSLISMYLKGNGDGSDLGAALRYGKQYLLIMLTGLPAFMMVQVYASTLRECGETVVPMKAGIIAVCVNLVFNYLLIYGKFGFPAMGVSGAAIATVLSRYVEAVVVLTWTHRHKEVNTYIVGLYRTLKVPMYLVKRFTIKGAPLLLNETLWASGMAMLMQCYSVRGLSVVAGLNIANTISNLFNVVFIALGDSVAIVIGQLLGAGKMKEARDTDTKMIAFSVACCTGVAVIMLLIAPLFPRLYNTSEQSREIAEYFIMATAVFMPQNAFLHATYFYAAFRREDHHHISFRQCFRLVCQCTDRLCAEQIYHALCGVDFLPCADGRLDQMYDRISLGEEGSLASEYCGGQEGIVRVRDDIWILIS